jgi:Arc/MetJ-type ribon-helix-helix transcriptional regulator
MKRTVHLPDDLARQVETYLAQHPEENWSSLVQKGLRRALRPREPGNLLESIGTVEQPSEASTDEDRYH